MPPEFDPAVASVCFRLHADATVCARHNAVTSRRLAPFLTPASLIANSQDLGNGTCAHRATQPSTCSQKPDGTTHRPARFPCIQPVRIATSPSASKSAATALGAAMRRTVPTSRYSPRQHVALPVRPPAGSLPRAHPRICVSAAHSKFLKAKTSFAGVRSPVQLIRLGASRKRSLNPSFLYALMNRSVAWLERITGPL